MPLTLEEQTYPNGSKYFEFIIRGHVIGNAVAVEDKYLVVGKKIPREKKQAAKQMIDDHLNRVNNELRYWQKVMMWLREDEGAL
jgi:hypothetical protein